MFKIISCLPILKLSADVSNCVECILQKPKAVFIIIHRLKERNKLDCELGFLSSCNYLKVWFYIFMRNAYNDNFIVLIIWWNTLWFFLAISGGLGNTKSM